MSTAATTTTSTMGAGVRAGLYAQGIAGAVGAVSTLGATFSAAKATRANARSSWANAALSSQQTGAYLAAGRSYAGAYAAYMAMAPKAQKIGEMNARADMQSAAAVDTYEDLQLWQSLKSRRQEIGGNLARFAANGVLLESRADSTAALWEQDECADLAIEQLEIMQRAEAEAYGHVRAAYGSLSQGWADAGNYYGNAWNAASSAHGAASSAYASALNEYYAIQDALYYEQQAKKQKRAGLLGAGLAGLAVASGVGAVTLGGASLAMGSLIGGVGAQSGATIGSATVGW